MRYSSGPKLPGPRVLSKREQTWASRRVQRELDSVCLFPELARFQTQEQMLSLELQSSRRYWQRIRDHDAATWRRARRDLRLLPSDVRFSILSKWQSDFWMPREAHYLADMIFQAQRNLGRKYLT